jgi:prepilin-type N-terminal cleavage/methylation domain-containing protein
MKTYRQNRRSERGDTIIEVLIAIAIASMVLATAYAITNRNLKNTQDTQEHNQSQQIAVQQIEGLRVLSANNALSAFANGNCVARDAADSPYLGSGANCKLNSDGSGSGCTVEPCYQVSITKDPITLIYEVKVTWSSLRGGNSSLTMSYGI